jgi:hypothetical protein
MQVGCVDVQILTWLLLLLLGVVVTVTVTVAATRPMLMVMSMLRCGVFIVGDQGFLLVMV